MAAFQFAFQPLAQKMFKQKNLKRELVNEEHCKEEWAKRKKVKTSYISPLPRKIEKVFSQFKDFDRNAASSKTKKIKILADSLEGCKTSHLTITTHATSEQQLTIPAENVEIMTDLNILALGSVEFLLPEFKNLSLGPNTNLR